MLEVCVQELQGSGDNEVDNEEHKTTLRDRFTKSASTKIRVFPNMEDYIQVGGKNLLTREKVLWSDAANKRWHLCIGKSQIPNCQTPKRSIHEGK